MKRNYFFIACFILPGIFYSCKKTPATPDTAEAQWIKVVDDSAVYFPGKIRADAAQNLFCSYNYTDIKDTARSAIVKLNAAGDLLERAEFPELNILDFKINSEGDLIAASGSNDRIVISKISSNDLSDTTIGSFAPPFTNIRDITGLKIFITAAGNYNVSGTVSFKGTINISGGFMMEATTEGALIWMKDFQFVEEDVSAGTSITGCTETASGGYFLIGNVQYDDPVVSKYFLIKCDASGDTSWTRFYNTSWYDSNADIYQYSGYYCGTSDIISDANGFLYACAFNVLYNTPWQAPVPVYTADDNSARIFKMNENGEILDSILVKHDFQNQVADFVLRKDGGFFIGFNPNKLGNFDVVGKRYSFVVRISPAFTLEKVSTIQTQYSDYLGSVFELDDGFVIETMIQSFGAAYYKLQVVKTDNIGNF